MPKYILAYHGSPAFTSKEEKAAQMEAWKTWSMQLGEAVIDPGKATCARWCESQ